MMAIAPKSKAKAKADCYSAQDRKMMVWWQHLRATTLQPILAGLSTIGLTADSITLLSFICGLAFSPLLFFSPPAALICLALHVALDGLDGPLARYRGDASNKGSLTDSLCDQTIIATTMATMIAAGIVHPVAGTLYIFLYTLVVVFAMIRNALTVPYALVLRPRFIVYAWLGVELFLFPNTINYLIWPLLAPLAWQTIRGFYIIRKNM